MTTLNPDLSKPTCRVCLQNNCDKMSSIFDADADANFYSLHIFEKIEQCAGIEVLRHGEMPTLICGDCYGLLKVSYNFRTICRSSNEYLLNFVAIKSASPKIEESLERNYLSRSENISKENATWSQHKTSIDCPLPETIKNEELVISHSPTNSEEFIDGNFDGEDWFDIDYQDDEDDISFDENLDISGEQIGLDVKKKIDESKKVKKPNKRKKKSDANDKNNDTVPSKTLEMCSDGTAIILVNKPRAKREKKENQPHICEVCGNIYQRRYSLELHMRKHRNEKPFACEICGYAFYSNFQLMRHMRKHTGARPYKCSYCPRAFGDQSTLIKHERVHRNERPFKCETCGKCFSYTGVLKYHKLVHTGEKPYACELCGKCFPRAHNLRDHLKTLQHQSDPRSKILLQNIRRNNDGEK